MNKLYKKIIFVIAITLSVLAQSCSSERTQDAIATTSEKVGQTAGELVKNVTTGVEKAFNIKIDISPELQNKGINLGKISLGNDSTGVDNKVSVYIIFNSDFKGTLTMKAFDNNALEMGRVQLPVEAKKNEARYCDFAFDVRTNIDRDSKLTIE